MGIRVARLEPQVSRLVSIGSVVRSTINMAILVSSLTNFIEYTPLIALENVMQEEIATCNHVTTVFTSANLVVGIGLQKGWIAKHFNFGNAFSNEHLDTTVQTELQIHLRSESDRKDQLPELNRSLNGPKETAMVWNNLLLKTFGEIGLNKVKLVR